MSSPTRPMSKSPLAVTRMALSIAQGVLPDYSSEYSRHDYTQPQLFAMLCLRSFFRVDYRGVVQILKDFSDLRRVLGLSKVPHFSTLCYAEKRLLKKAPLRSFSERCSVALVA